MGVAFGLFGLTLRDRDAGARGQCQRPVQAARRRDGVVDFPELLLTPGVGPRTVQALAMVAEVVHGAPYRFTDPARFSFARGSRPRPA